VHSRQRLFRHARRRPDAGDDGVHYPGTYLAGGYNRLTSEVAGRTIRERRSRQHAELAAADLPHRGGPWFRLDQVEILDYRQELDLRHGSCGATSASATARAGSRAGRSGASSAWSNPHLAGLEVSLTPENWSGVVTVPLGHRRQRDLAWRHLWDACDIEIDTGADADTQS
jgi:alpha,alpha-trehalase